MSSGGAVMSQLEALSPGEQRRLWETGAVYATLNGRLFSLDGLGEGQTPPPGLRLHLRVLGGKGGFGSLLRSFRFHKSSNEDMCRDLSGRRLRDVKEEAKLKKWIASKAQREADKEAKKQAKFEKLKAGPPKHVFQDPEYHRTGEEILDKIEDAVASGLRAAESAAESRTGKRKADGAQDSAALLKKKLKTDDPWLDVDLSDLSDSEEEEAVAEVEGEGEGEEVGPDVASSSWTFSAGPAQEETPTSSTSGIKAAAEAHRKKLLRMLTGPAAANGAAKTSPPVQLKSFEKKDPDALTAPAQQASTPKSVEKNAEEKEKAPKRTEEKASTEPETYSPIDLEMFGSADEIAEKHSIQHLKAELIRRGLKCGGSLPERAARLWLVRGLSADAIPAKLRAKA